MKTAVVFNKESGFSKEMSASEFERRYVGNKDLHITASHPEELEHIEAISKDDALPLTFRKSHFRMGRTEHVGACWVRPDGFGDHDHLFDHGEQQKLDDAIKDGKKVLLSLNLDLTSRPVSFENMREAGADNLENWIGHNRGNFVTVSVKSAEQAIKTIKKTHEMGRTLGDSVFALHRGAVVPYNNFYLGDNRQKMSSLYNNMQDGLSGTPHGETRMIGFPRLICFVPTDKTVETHGGKGMKGNHLKSDEGKPYISNLIFTDREQAMHTDPYQILEGEIASGTPEYILASPGIEVSQEKDSWKILHWVIKDAESQTFALDEDAQEKLLAHIEKMSYNCKQVKEAIQLRLFEDKDLQQDGPAGP